jgi:endoglucanase
MRARRGGGVSEAASLWPICPAATLGAVWRRVPFRSALHATAVLFVVLSVAHSSTEPARSAEPGTRNPLAGQSFYVDPRSPAALQAARWRSEGRPADAAAMKLLAARPTAAWLVDGRNVSARVQSFTLQAARVHKSSLLVAYYIPSRDCGGYSAGGAPSARAYRAWIRAFARGIGDRRATVILEPDAVPDAVSGCLSRPAAAERYALIRSAIHTLTTLPRATVYLDAGNAGWILPPSRLVRPLRRAGIGAADGFALNVSNFYRTAATIKYGRALSRRLGGRHFVVDTGRNGNGASQADGGRPEAWCNPPGRALGADPTTNTRQTLVDAYLWVKFPGESDGACRPGAPEAGQWWPEYALELVRNRS